MARSPKARRVFQRAGRIEGKLTADWRKGVPSLGRTQDRSFWAPPWSGVRFAPRMTYIVTLLKDGTPGNWLGLISLPPSPPPSGTRAPPSGPPAQWA